jgi:hypothetical protein
MKYIELTSTVTPCSLNSIADTARMRVVTTPPRDHREPVRKKTLRRSSLQLFHVLTKIPIDTNDENIYCKDLPLFGKAMPAHLFLPVTIKVENGQHIHVSLVVNQNSYPSAYCPMTNF